MNGFLTRLDVFRRFRQDKRGVSAVEFALLLPIMLTLYFGTVEVSQMVSVKRKLSHATSALGDLVTQYAKLDGTEMSNILDASSAIMVPFPDSELKIVLSGVWVDDKGKAKVTWSEARHRAPLAKNAPISLPGNMNVADTGLVVAELEYKYTPSIGYALTGSFVLKDQFFLRPRVGDEVEYNK